MPTKALSKADISEKLLNAKRAAATQLLSATPALPRVTAFAISTHPSHNVVGVGIGYKVTKGKPTTKRCIRLYVERKVAKEAIPKDLVLPASIDGVPTDVIETGRFRALLARVPIGQRRLRPAKPGCSVGFQFTGSQAGFVMAGTFGAVVGANG